MSTWNSRRKFIKKSLLGSSFILAGNSFDVSASRVPAIEVINPRGLPPVSFIIDDSTALVNMAHFGIPQFQEVFPEQYRQDWRSLPREIPDSFVMKFAEWCDQHGVKGKYSMVPFPACTGWLHRYIPGWTRQEMVDSIALVRDQMQPSWDIHPEMISHTRVIDLKTGLPFPFPTPEYMENWEWSQNKSSDELAAYIAKALGVLKEAGLYCEGITTPGGFGSRNMDNLAMGTLEACRDVYQTEIPHFFRDVRTGEHDSVEPELFHVSGLDSSDPRCSVHIIGCTDDWFGNWDGLVPGDPDKFITPNLEEGRMVEVLEQDQPGIMVCHWPGIYYNGSELGFEIFKTVVQRLEDRYSYLNWMKISEIARYWAAKKLTKMELGNGEIYIDAPFSTPDFTVKVDMRVKNAMLIKDGKESKLTTSEAWLQPANSIKQAGKSTQLCFELPKGKSKIILN